jgi:hypothetical protein
VVHVFESINDKSLVVGLSSTVFWPDCLDTNRSILRAVSLKFAYARDRLQFDDDDGGEIHFISIFESIVSSSCKSGQFDNKNVLITVGG